ncbi:MAG TPA: alpha/beta hydrolase, partial [Candidatus Limnocylindrales bacterium]|nr:alpha/beta hydrolase [Candidatus Limnocylindrales bacterium]
DGGADIVALADALGLERFAVAGWSSGGPYALAVGALAPERIRGLAVIAGDAPTDELPELLEEESGAGRERIRAIREGDPSALASLRARLAWFAESPDRLLGAATGNDDEPDMRMRAVPAYRAALESMFAEGFRQGSAGFEADWLASYRPWGFRLADVRVPVDVWWGDADRLSSRGHADALVARIPEARFHLVPGGGHSIAATEWSAILDALLASRDA